MKTASCLGTTFAVAALVIVAGASALDRSAERLSMPSVEQQQRIDDINDVMTRMNCSGSSNQVRCDMLRHKAAQLAHSPLGGTVG